MLGPRIPTARDYRECETQAIRHAMLESWTAEGDLPDDPIARYAAVLGIRYLHEGYESEILDTLLESDRSHPAYRETLKFLVCEMRTRNLDIPDQLLRWEREKRASDRTLDARTLPGTIGSGWWSTQWWRETTFSFGTGTLLEANWNET